jgi:hypothetical protein
MGLRKPVLRGWLVQFKNKPKKYLNLRRLTNFIVFQTGINKFSLKIVG